MPRSVPSFAVAIALVLPITGCSSASVGDIQKQISKGLNQQFQAGGGSSQEQISASVTCPKNVSLSAGSVFYCQATITRSPLNSPGSSSGSGAGVSSGQSTRRQVLVTIENSNKAHWVLQ